MTIPEARYEGTAKFMWDGEIYPSAEAATEKKKEYEKNRFETRLVEEGGQALIYTRRIVTEIVVQPPA